MGTELIRALSIFFLGATKLLWAPGTAAAAGLTFWETVLICSAGSITGVLFFYFFGRAIFIAVDNWRASKRAHEKPRRVFSKKNRMVINVKSKFGVVGLTFLTPCIISIPLGCIIAAKFFYHNKLTVPLLLLFSVFWSFALSFFAFYVKDLIAT
jgi:membrane protein YqaA with SNARE-associated domain